MMDMYRHTRTYVGLCTRLVRPIKKMEASSAANRTSAFTSRSHFSVTSTQALSFGIFFSSFCFQADLHESLVD
jgi:hypothetical protein